MCDCNMLSYDGSITFVSPVEFIHLRAEAEYDFHSYMHYGNNNKIENAILQIKAIGIENKRY